MTSRLFWRKRIITVQEDGLVKFTIARRTYSYQIYEPEMFFSAQNSKLKIYYDERNLSEIHLFNRENRFMGSIEPRLEFDGTDENILKKHRAGKHAINKYAKDQKKKWSESLKPSKDFAGRSYKTHFVDDLDSEQNNEGILFEKINNIRSRPTDIML